VSPVSAAAGVAARVPPQPANIAPIELSTELHIQSRRVTAWPQQVMPFSSTTFSGCAA
jgi:hypothetical protein